MNDRTAAQANAAVTITKPSPWSVADTVSRIEQVLASKGIKLFAVIDHSGEAHASGLELRETKVVIFGSPASGTPATRYPQSVASPMYCTP
jgi:uncharacterized protein (DUF302 family)